MIYLPDINVWIALAVAEHVHYEPAAEWLREPLDSSSKDEIAFCRVTQMGFLRLLTSPKAMGKDATYSFGYTLGWDPNVKWTDDVFGGAADYKIAAGVTEEDV